MKLTISKRIIFGFMIILSIALITSSFTIYNTFQIAHEVEHNEKQFNELGLLSDFELQFTRTTLAYMDAIVEKSSKKVVQEIVSTHEELINFIKKNKNILLGGAENDEDKKKLEEIFNDTATFTEAGTQIISLISTDPTSEQLAKQDEIVDELTGKIAAKFKKITAQIEKEYNDSTKMVQSEVTRSIALQWISIIIILIAGILLSIFITQKINKVLLTITNSLAQIADESLSTSSKLATSAQQLSASATQQASSLEETSASLEEISGMVQNNVSNSETAYKHSNDVMSKSKSGNDTMAKLQDSMKQILDSNEQIENLVKVIANIGEKTQIMDEIVFQTKLLSFNASVEAERAGEHGRGFAVVAQEVGNLAQMSGKAAQEIAEIVQESIKTASEITDENKKRVDQGGEFVTNTAKILKDIEESSVTVAEGSNQVLSASREQSNGIQQIASAVSQLDKATQESSGIAEATTSASSHLEDQSIILKDAVAELTELVIGKRVADLSSMSSNKPKEVFEKPSKPIVTPKRKEEPKKFEAPKKKEEPKKFEAPKKKEEPKKDIAPKKKEEPKKAFVPPKKKEPVLDKKTPIIPKPRKKDDDDDGGWELL